MCRRGEVGLLNKKNIVKIQELELIQTRPLAVAQAFVLWQTACDPTVAVMG